jgi:hypothetical protein
LLPPDVNLVSTEHFKRNKKKEEEEQVAEKARGRENSNDISSV